MVKSFIAFAALALVAVPAAAVPVIISDNTVGRIAPPVIVSDNVVVEDMGRPNLPIIISDDVVTEECEFQIWLDLECDEDSDRNKVLRSWQE